jgi:hypothetical protein
LLNPLYHRFVWVGDDDKALGTATTKSAGLRLGFWTGSDRRTPAIVTILLNASALAFCGRQAEVREASRHAHETRIASGVPSVTD